MKSFKEHEAEVNESEETTEAMTMQQRMKAKATFRKNKSKIAMGRKKASRKLASPEKLKGKANKAARNLIIKRLLKDKDKADLSFSGRQGLEKKVDKRKVAIARIAKKLLPAIKKADRAKLKKGPKK
tara:strand:- start:11 stop:391 length:381 start_codon:yes stop_codon:yes gene_type:complete